MGLRPLLFSGGLTDSFVVTVGIEGPVVLLVFLLDTGAVNNNHLVVLSYYVSDISLQST